MEKLLKIRQAAKLTGFHRETLKRWIKEGRGPNVCLSPGGHYLFKESDIIAWQEELQVIQPRKSTG
jgi:excisionase family DNA binding protein